MPLSDLRRQQLRLYTGYPSTGLQVNRILENAMNAVDANGSTELLVMIEAELDACLAVDASITATASRLSGGGYKRIEDVEYFGPGVALIPQRNVGLMHVTRLCTLLSVPLRQNPFSSGPLGGLTRLG